MDTCVYVYKGYWWSTDLFNCKFFAFGNVVLIKLIGKYSSAFLFSGRVCVKHFFVCIVLFLP